MKKSLIVFIMVLLFGFVVVQIVVLVSVFQVFVLIDVFVGYWVKDVIDCLVSRGVILGYFDGMFCGIQNLICYEVVIIIVCLFDQMCDGEIFVGMIVEDMIVL